MQAIKKFVYNYDMFAAVPGFRARGQASVVSCFGGFLSLLLLAFFTNVFIQDSIKIINYQKISSDLTTKISQQGTQRVTDLKFSVGINGFTLAQLQMALKFTAYQISTTQNGTSVSRQLSLTRCTEEMFSDVANISEIFQIFNINETYCLAENQSVLLTGLPTDQTFERVEIQVYLCLECVAIPGVNVTQIIQEYVRINKFYTINFLVMNTGFNPTEKVSSFKYLDQNAWVTFTDRIGTELQMKFGSYKVQTDECVLPWQVFRNQTGAYIQDMQSATFDPSTLLDPKYAIIQLRMGRESKEYSRVFGKLDNTLGYVGGLFSIVFGFFAFFIMKYNEYRYELIAGESAFSFSNGIKYNENQFNFFTYIKYSIYDWIKLLCCCAPNWENCERIQEIRQQVCQQIDIKHFMRRVTHLEHINILKISEDQDLLFHLAEPKMISYSQKKRKILAYCESVMKDKPYITFDSVDTVRNVLAFGGGLFGKESASLFSVNQEASGLKGNSIQDLLKSHEDYLEEEDAKLQLTDDQYETERELSQLFFKVDYSTVEKIKNKVPIFILFRLHKIYNTEIKFKNLPLPITIKVHPKMQ